MPQIPLPPSANPGSQQARSIGVSRVQADGDAFGAQIAAEELRGARERMGLYEQQGRREVAQIASLGEQSVDNTVRTTHQINNLATRVVGMVGEQLQRDWRLEAEAEMEKLAQNQERRQEGLSPTGDGASVRKGIEGFDDDAQKLLASAKSPYQANIYREGIQRLRFQVERAAVSREVGAIKQKRMDQLATITEGGQVEVLRDPAKLPDVLARTSATIEGANLTATQKSNLLEANRKALYSVAVESYVTGNQFGPAQELLKSDEAIKALGPLESLRAQQRVSKGAEEWAEKQAAAERQRGLMEGLIPLDPTSAEDRKAVDDSFVATGGPRLLTQSDPNAALFVTNVAKKYGVVPKSALSILSAQALNGDIEQRAYAYQTINQVEAVRPGAFKMSGASERVREEADDFRHMTSGMDGLGLDIEDAIARIDEMRSADFQARASARKAEIQDKRNGPLATVDMERELISAFDDAYFSDPVIGNPRDRDVILATAQRTLEHHYIRTGDVDMAKAATVSDMRRTYGLSRLSGDGTARVVRNPIEQRYPAIDGSHDYIREQAAAAIKAETGQDVDPEAIFFENNRATEEALARGGFQTGNPPPYGFYWRAADKDGVVRDQTIPGRLFVPDIAEARQKATDAATGERRERGSSSYYAPHNVIRRAVGAKTLEAESERQVSAAEMEATAKRAEAAAAEATPEPDPKKVERENQQRDLMDLFGFGARAAAGGN